MTRTTIPNLKLFFGIKIMKGVLFILKPLTFLSQCQVFHFRTYPEFGSLSRFLDKTHFTVFHNIQNKSQKVKITL